MEKRPLSPTIASIALLWVLLPLFSRGVSAAGFARRHGTSVGSVRTMEDAFCGPCSREREPYRIILGVRFGGGATSVSELDGLFDDGSRKTDYTYASRWGASYMGSVFANYRRGNWGVELSTTFSHYTAKLEQHYMRQGYTDTYRFNYPYVHFGLYGKLYFAEDAYVGLGARYGLSIATRHIDFRSEHESLVQIGQVRDRVNLGFTEQNEIGVGIVVGYELPVGLLLEGSCHIGLSDITTTKIPNTYGFFQAHNKTVQVGLTVGWPIRIQGKRRSDLRP